ncbi:MAG TPA: fibronectin type III domain-containing protein [Bacillota bacterium]|nr:fibronectin type III domain-containing protein [Bacillota bacterium]
MININPFHHNQGRITLQKRYLLLPYLLLLLLSLSLPPRISQAQEESDTATLIKLALTTGETALFELGRDFKFTRVVGVTTASANGDMDGYSMPTNQAKGCILLNWHKTFRIHAGEAGVDEDDMQCSVQLLSGGRVGIQMKKGDMTSVSQGWLKGVIKGNTLTATAESSQYTLINGFGQGFSVHAEFTVSVQPVPVSEWPPLAPENLTAEERDDRVIVLSWEDPNPKGAVVAYDIYREAGFWDYKSYKIGTVSNRLYYVDDSQEAIGEKELLMYSVVARAKNGKESSASFVNVNILNRLLSF